MLPGRDIWQNVHLDLERMASGQDNDTTLGSGQQSREFSI